MTHNEWYPGKGCTCAAINANECGCNDVSWAGSTVTDAVWQKAFEEEQGTTKPTDYRYKNKLDTQIDLWSDGNDSLTDIDIDDLSTNNLGDY